MRCQHEVEEKALEFIRRQYQRNELLQLCAKTVRRQLIESGHNNIAAALKSGLVDESMRSFISMAEIRGRYTETVRRHVEENSNSKYHGLGPV